MNKYSPRGLALCTGPGLTAKPDLDKPFLRHLLVRPGWNELEPEPGVYDWSLIDQNLALADYLDKTCILAPFDGPKAPLWLYNEGCKEFTYEEKQADGTYSTKLMPRPWDAKYLERKAAFVAKLGKRYDADPRVQLVHCTAASYNGLEFSLPEINPHGGNYRAAWNAAGYSPENLKKTWASVIDCYALCFNYTFLDADIHPIFGDYTIAQANIGVGQLVGGNMRFGTYGGWLSGRTDLYPQLFPLVAECGQNSMANFQLIGNWTNQPQRFPAGLDAAFQQAFDWGCRLVEVWRADAINPAMASKLTAWNDKFAGG